MENSIEGTWQSYYEYSKGTADEPQTSEHRVKFVYDNGAWVGTSLPSEDGSELTIMVWQDGHEFKGEWHERTSSTGDYKGHEFSGSILLLLQAEGNELNGMWLGANSSADRVKCGEWNLKRV